MAKRIVRQLPKPPEPKTDLDPEYVAHLAKSYKTTKDTIAEFTKRADKLKKELTQFVIDHGEPDENGSLWLEVEGMKLKRERRVSRSLNAAAAEEWAKGYEVWEMVSELIPEHRALDEDALLRFAWESDDVDIVQTIQGFYTENESWAFRTP